MSSLPKKDAIGGAVTKDNVTLRCGDCMHYRGTSHPMYGERCVDRGVRAGGVAPACYTPNVGLFRRHSMDTLRVLSTLIINFSPQECRVLMGMLNKASRLEKFGFTYMEKVYFHVGDRYLNNFYSGHVMATGIENTLLIIGAKQLDSKTPLLAHLPADSVYSLKKFKRLRVSMIEKGLINDPEARRKKLPRNVEVDYEPPTIDSSQYSLEESLRPKIGKRKGITTTRREGGGKDIKLDLSEASEDQDTISEEL